MTIANVESQKIGPLFSFSVFSFIHSFIHSFIQSFLLERMPNQAIDMDEHLLSLYFGGEIASSLRIDNGYFCVFDMKSVSQRAITKIAVQM